MLEKDGLEEIKNKKDQEFAEKILNKYSQKPLIRLLRVRTNNCRVVTYPFQLVSLLSIIAFVSWFSSDYSGWVYCGIITFLSLVAIGWEIAKRFAIIETFDGVWNPTRKWKLVFLPLVLVLIAGSFLGSYKGGDEFTKTQVKAPTLVYNSAIDSIKSKIEKDESLISSLQATTWKKKITRTANKGINSTQELQIQRQAQIAKLEEADKLENDQIINKHEAKKSSLGSVLGGIAGAMDFLILICLGFAEHFETEADKLVRSLTTGNQQVAQQQSSSYQQLPSNATQRAAQQPISENKSRIGFHIPKNGFVSDQKRVTQADTQPDTKVTQKPETRVAHGTQPDTALTRPQKDPDYIINMKKRIRQRWARSFPEHAKSPKNEGMRSNLKELALEEWGELEEMGYKITKDVRNVPWGLDIVSPQKRS